jgi:hypothetical protein
MEIYMNFREKSGCHALVEVPFRLKFTWGASEAIFDRCTRVSRGGDVRLILMCVLIIPFCVSFFATLSASPVRTYFFSMYIMVHSPHHYCIPAIRRNCHLQHYSWIFHKFNSIISHTLLSLGYILPFLKADNLRNNIFQALAPMYCYLLSNVSRIFPLANVTKNLSVELYLTRKVKQKNYLLFKNFDFILSLVM